MYPPPANYICGCLRGRIQVYWTLHLVLTLPQQQHMLHGPPPASKWSHNLFAYLVNPINIYIDKLNVNCMYAMVQVGIWALRSQLTEFCKYHNNDQTKQKSASDELE